MKKKNLCFLVGALLAAPVMNAQESSPVMIVSDGYRDYLPAEYSVSGKSMMVIAEYDGEYGDNTRIIKVYDENLNNVATINIPYITEGVNGFVGISPVNFNIGSAGGGDHFEIIVSQTLFNDDAEYEYVAPIVSNDDDEEDKIIGLVVKTESGKELQKIKVAEGHHFSELQLTIIGDKKYLTVESYDDDRNDYCTYYNIDKTSGLRQVGEPVKVSVSPVIINQGESVNVKVGETKGNASITVSDIQGRTVYTTVANESGVYPIPGSVMSKGMNILTVKTPGKSTHSSKVIVR